jgi:uncharacterized repeat protein (TIGR01451 family)
LTAGTYTVTVTDDNYCTTTAEVTITQSDAALSATITSQTDVLCYGDSTGEIDLTVNGGTLDYTYLWSTTDGGGLVIDTEDQSGLTAGTYEVLITDANGCTTTNSVIISEPDTGLDVLILSQVNIECTGLGSVTLETTGGTSPYDYSLNGGTSQNSGIFNDLTEGDYVIIVTDMNGCTFTVSIFIENDCIALVKEVEFIDLDEDNCADEGETLLYTFTVTNEGNTSISAVTVTDVLLGGDIAGPISGDINGDMILDVDETWTYTQDYTITQDDIDAGTVTNTATVNGTGATGPVSDIS